MRIDVIGKHLDITDAIREHAEAKVNKLPRFFNGIQHVAVRVSREDHASRGVYDVELVVSVQKHDDLVASARGDDVYMVIDQAVSKSTRQLAEFKDKLRLGNR